MEWRAVVGFEDSYEISNDGQVRSLDKHIPVKRPVGSIRFIKGRILKPTTIGPYPYVTLGRGNIRLIHNLVAEAYIGPKPRKYDVMHADGDVMNNKVENLYYAFRKKTSNNNFKMLKRRTLIRLDIYQTILKSMAQKSNDVAFGFLFRKFKNL